MNEGRKKGKEEKDKEGGMVKGEVSMLCFFTYSFGIKDSHIQYCKQLCDCAIIKTSTVYCSCAL